MGLIIALIVGCLAGWLAGNFFRGKGFGVFGNMVVGVVGAMLGRWIFQAVGLHASGFLGSLITATAGAVVLLVLLRWLGMINR